jgi:hypothetical protein
MVHGQEFFQTIFDLKYQDALMRPSVGSCRIACAAEKHHSLLSVYLKLEIGVFWWIYYLFWNRSECRFSPCGHRKSVVF